MKSRFVLIFVLGLCAAAAADAQRSARVVATVGGDDVYEVLPVGAIPAIDEPQFVTGEAADRQMKAAEPVIGVVIDGDVRAYSMWQLDAHEIVNDTISGTAIAVTW